MEQKLPEQLQLLSDQIYDEELSILMERMVDLELNGNHPKRSGDQQTEYEKCAAIFLRSMRIHLCLDLIRQGYSACTEVFQKDWDEIVACMEFLEAANEVIPKLLSDAVDLILLLDPTKRRALLRMLDLPTRLKLKKTVPLDHTVPDCAFVMVQYCHETGRMDELRQVITSVVALSQSRLPGDSALHRFTIARALFYTVDYDHQFAAQIGQAHEKCFRGVVNFVSTHFYWFYGFAQLKLENQAEAISLLKHCYDLCMQTEGETSWLGLRAVSFYHYSKLLQESSAESEEFLWDSLKKIDDGFYEKMDETADFVAATTRAVLLKYHMDHQNMHGLLPEIERYLAYCVAVEETNDSPLLTVRRAENVLAGYYLESGDYLQAADHSAKALASTPPNGLPADPSDLMLYSNLLLTYTCLNDVDQMAYYADKLADLSDEYEDDDFMSFRAAYLINTAYQKIYGAPHEPEELREIIHDFYEEISDFESAFTSDAEYLACAQWVLNCCSNILDALILSADELKQIREIITYFLERPEKYKFNNTQLCAYYALLTQTEWLLNSPRALIPLEKCLGLIDSISECREGRISILRFAAVVYYTFRRRDLALNIVEQFFSSITAAWQKATSYLNDQRICQLLSFIQLHLLMSYSMVRTCREPRALYEYVLRFKNLPALVGRERNKILRLAPVDEALKEQIFKKQDQLAAAELNDSLNGTDNAARISAELEHLEALFAEQFPQNLNFTNITYDGVCEKLPNNSAIIEYFFVLNDSFIARKVTQPENLELEVFVTTKRNGISRLDHLKIKRADIIIGQVERFVSIMQDPDDLSASGEKSSLRGELYRKLIAPVLPCLTGITHLYLAPDDQLCNLPFEILYADGSGLLQDKYKVCRLVCGRDLLFHDDRHSAGGCFILGDPNYESERGERTQSRTRGAQMQLEPVRELPFSGIEAARIGKRCRAQAYTGDAATKFALQEMLPCRVIHLATHGIFDEEAAEDSLYASHLVFAGYNKWVSHKTESRFCGNGVLTADEISRMDLKKTELVVLSACRSGLGDTSYGSVRGLLSAFSAAGARWIVTHMWEADDFSTPILMDAFYDAWQNRGLDIPDALQHAKNYLKNVTISTLLREGWLDPVRDPRIPNDYLAKMRAAPPGYRPFEDEFYWGGFTVHKSR